MKRSFGSTHHCLSPTPTLNGCGLSPSTEKQSSEMTPRCDVTNNVYPATMTIIRDCSVWEFFRGHTIKQSPQASPDVCMPLCSSQQANNTVFQALDLETRWYFWNFVLKSSMTAWYQTRTSPQKSPNLSLTELNERNVLPWSAEDLKHLHSDGNWCGNADPSMEN